MPDLKLSDNEIYMAIPFHHVDETVEQRLVANAATAKAVRWMREWLADNHVDDWGNIAVLLDVELAEQGFSLEEPTS